MKLLGHPSNQNVHETEFRIRQALEGLRYGSIEIVIHDSKIVQIERKEKFRFDTAPSRPVQ